jgi:hypothetical protein
MIIRNANCKNNLWTIRFFFGNTSHKRGTWIIIFPFIFQFQKFGFVMSILFSIVILNFLLRLGLQLNYWFCFTFTESFSLDRLLKLDEFLERPFTNKPFAWSSLPFPFNLVLNSIEFKVELMFAKEMVYLPYNIELMKWSKKSGN